MKRSTRLGIFGGSFDPVHNGHLILAQTALEQLDLDKVLFMPCAVQPHKRQAPAAPGDLRAAMIQSAIEDHPAFELLDIELRRGGISYTVDSLRAIRTRWPDASLYLLIGADTLGDLHRWKEIDVVLEHCTPIPFARPGWDAGAVDPAHLDLPSPWPERLTGNMIRIRQVDISASEIRHRVAEGLSIRYLVPREVEMIIHERHLYC